MPRERYQRGSLKRVGKRVKCWKGVWYIYVPDADGGERRKHTSKILGRCADLTKAEAQKKLDEAIAEGDRSPAAATRLTVEQFARKRWIPAHRNWSNNTRIQYESQLKNYILPNIGNLLLSDVRKMHIVDLVNAMADADRSHATIDAVIGQARAIFSEAVDNDLIAKNPVTKIENPVPANGDTKATLNAGQIRALLSSTSGHVRLLFSLLLMCGLRVGEAMVLRWRAVERDGDGWRLRVSESWDRRVTGPKSTKTRRVRLVPLASRLADDLARFREAAYFSGDGDYIFCDEKGRHTLDPKARELYLEPAREVSGLGDLLDFRICRRTLATRLKDAGVNVRDIQAILGHTDEATTTGHYIQPVEESQRRAVEAFADFLH